VVRELCCLFRDLFTNQVARLIFKWKDGSGLLANFTNIKTDIVFTNSFTKL